MTRETNAVQLRNEVKEAEAMIRLTVLKIVDATEAGELKNAKWMGVCIGWNKGDES